MFFVYDGKYEQKLDITLQESHSLSIMSYNVKDGFENKDTKKERFLEWLKRYDPDIMLFQELNKFTEKSLGEFAKKYGHEYAYIVKEDGYPTGITSRYPLTNVEKILRVNKKTLQTPKKACSGAFWRPREDLNLRPHA